MGSVARIFRNVWRRRSGRWSLAVIGVVVVLAILAPVVAPHPPNAQLDIVALRTQPPSLAHPFGTDDFSRDLLSRVLFGARVSLTVATLAVLLSVTIGFAYGLAAGYAGGWVDAVMMRVLDAFLSVPRVLLLIAALALWNPVPLPVLILLLGGTGWFGVSRLVRAEAMALRGRDFVLAARALGGGGWRVVRHHIAPNAAAPVIVAATLAVGNVIALEAGLSYLGIGVREPAASWGGLLRAGTESFASAWWMVVFPGAVMVATVLAFNILGDALRDAADPRQLPGARREPVSGRATAGATLQTTA